MSTMEYRSAEVGEVRPEAREIDLTIAPYGEIADLGLGIQERYSPGVFDPLPDAIALKLETAKGHSGPVIGRSMRLWSDDAGVHGTFKISATPAGDDALTLSRDGALGASAGFVLKDAEPEGDVIALRSGSLREATLTGTPAYQSAGVVAVRSHERDDMSEHNERADDGAEHTEATPEAAATENVITDAVTRALDAYRAEVADAAAPAPTQIEGRSRGHLYRSIGEVMADALAHNRNDDAAARDRLGALIERGLVSPRGDVLNLTTRDGFPPADTGNSIGSGVAYDAYVPELLELLREGRPVLDLFTSRPLPTEGNKVFFPATSVGNTVAFQDGQGVDVEATRQDQILTDWPKGTIAGGQGVTIQAEQWTNPNYMAAVVEDLLRAHAEYADWASINGDPAVETPASSTGFTGILNAGATDVPVGGDHAAAIALIGTAWAAVYAGSRRSPIAAAMNSADWGSFLDEVDTDGRPLVTTEAPSNPVGFGDASQIAGTLRGLPVVLDDNIAVGNVILGSYRDAVHMESGAAQVMLTFPKALVTDVTVYAHHALAIRRPAAFAVLSGIV